MLAVILPIGLVVGVALGALGGGGSIVTVPALVYLLGLDPRSATTGSLVIVGVTTLIGVVPHLRAGRVRPGQGVVFGLLGVGGAFAGSLMSAAVPQNVLLAAFAVLMLVVAAVMTRRRRAAARAAAPGGREAELREAPMISLRPFRCGCQAVAVLVATATAVGMLTGFFGVGGGFAVVPALVLALRMPMPVAVGTSLVVITVNSASSLLFRLGQDVSLDWGVIAAFSAAAVAGSFLGARITSRVRPDRLNLAFTVLLVVVALYTAVRSISSFL
ncbi:sulfite exporter TauE/SafE family protein [Myceligenerans indicum]|uniref:Probable membrane transporter protein n=1 Tax=Myceligenerans indicum TaxID=2593663 RepID=A0ABS1LI95_9MICO|nr:sulfite exporter TauE/SafE family protein [Myceligenerans indicum]MBL0885960.1 sulfite exporter TauE/SafE family protein [Myceligenerans indicum]